MASRCGALLRKWRQRAGLSQEALAERAVLGVRTIRGLETGERGDPRVGTLRVLADALQLNRTERAELFGAAGRTEPSPAEGMAQRVPAGRATTDGFCERIGGASQSPHGPTLIADRLAEAADALAYAVHTRWQREEERRQIHDPVPLPVRWCSAPASLRDSWANVRMAKPGETVRRVDLDGQLDQIVEVYQRIPSRRLVVLGRAGSGKTILTMRFVLDLLAARDPASPVPVIFSLGSWNPARTGLRDWLAEQLVRDHPGLAAPGPGGATLAAALVDAHRVLPVLDGFDEIADGLHRAALAALNATTLPLLLTSRGDEYRAAVEATDVLTAAGAVELADVTAADLAQYLPRTTQKTGHAGNVWQAVLDKVRADPGGALASVLTTPLMVALARRIYSDTPDHDPAELLDVDRFGERTAIELHLLGSFVPAVYQGRRGIRSYDLDHVRRWLGFLAHHLDRLGTHDLAWWQLGSRIPGWLRMLVSGLVLGIAAGFAAAFIIGLIHTAGLGTAGAGFGNGLSAGLAAGPLEGLALGLTVGLGHGAVLVFGGTVFEPSRVRIQLRGASHFGATFLRRGAVGLAVGVGLGAGLGIASKLGATFWIVGRVGVTTGTAALFGLTLGLAWGLTWVVMASFEAPVDISSAASPMNLLNANRRTVAVQSLIFGLVTCAGYTIVVVALHGPWYGLAYGLSYGLVLGLGVGLGAASLTAWGTWMVFARVWLPLNGRLPWSLPAFLEDAYRRGVLRRSGAVYQFRHARLQDHLTKAYRAGR
ncbi:helix-turn-helix domain-containing protein [Actinopolymorpha alba]|uniref:helix-turn-helix domain-containing protein n=1 Tax=Actinopolymorpha alba TaxID=533267 RepID=UPI0004779727|nr:helix-turn-helix domain-containing protein [Actinopolymorpha alba]